MPKIYPPSDVAKVLERLGFEFVDQEWSHRGYFKRWIGKIIVPMHPRDLKTGLFRALLKRMNLTLEEFQSVLKKKPK